MSLLRRRPPTSALVFFGAAALLALAAAGLVANYVRDVGSSRPDVGAPTMVVVAATDLDRGVELSSIGGLTTREVPASLVPPGAFSAPEQVVGRVLISDLSRDEIVTRTRVSEVGTGPIAAQVPAGLRAFVLPSGVPAATIGPGDVVDVLATYGAGGGRPFTDTIVSGIEVLTVLDAGDDTSAIAGAPGREGATIVVLADPDTVEALARAVALGVVTVSIAGPDEVATPLA
jgi:Flp pilus assembly protein CpaB